MDLLYFLRNTINEEGLLLSQKLVIPSFIINAVTNYPKCVFRCATGTTLLAVSYAKRYKEKNHDNIEKWFIA